MLRRLLGRDLDFASSAEEVAVARLAAAQRRLIVEGSRVDTKSEAGFSACSAFLESLDAAARSMRLETAPRSYRGAFTINYQALFPEDTRSYRVDVLEASVEQYAVIWVNGDKFEFSAEAMRRAETLQRAWAEVGSLLRTWGQATDQVRAQAQSLRFELRAALVALDFAWAGFEQKYIGELIEIEEKARRLVVTAIEKERGLQALEAAHGGLRPEEMDQLPEYLEQLRRFVACVSRLNAVANFHRKGRDDLRVQVLLDAARTLRRCKVAEQSGEDTEALRAARVLATDVVESFGALRAYLREVESCLERVDPHLCNNAGLVARLVDWEESWEVGTRYVQNERILRAVCDLVAEIRTAQRVAPALTAMCEDCDVELFLILPRIIWLRFLAQPLHQLELMASLLPHRFPEARGGSGLRATAQQQAPWDSELQDFAGRFRAATELLSWARPGGPAPPGDTFAWQLLLRRVVIGAAAGGAGGAGGAAAVPSWADGLAPGLGEGAEAAVEELMHELEKWSIELQRHCPDDWNQCSAILVQCLAGPAERQKDAPFHV